MIEYFIDRQGSHAVNLHLICHRSQASAIIINCPGFRGDIDGYNMKYRVLGEHLALLGVGAVVQMPNIERSTDIYGAELVKDVQAVVRFALENADALCAAKNPAIYLMGFSAGGYAVAFAGAQSEAVKKILLMEPSASRELLGSFQGYLLERFAGEVYVVIGDHNGVGLATGKAYRDSFSGASKRELVVVTNCDHQFQGSANGQVMSKAPLWAFAGDTTFPSPEGGLKLY